MKIVAPVKLLVTALFILITSLPVNASNLPSITGETWLNTAPLNQENFKNKVVLVYFWTFGCHNCKAVQPYIKQWHKRYADKGLIVVGVHSPEFSFEKNIVNVRNYLAENAITYPVVIDNDFINWRRFSNQYWPTIYLANTDGQLVYRKIGEGDYSITESWIRDLLTRARMK